MNVNIIPSENIYNNSLSATNNSDLDNLDNLDNLDGLDFQIM